MVNSEATFTYPPSMCFFAGGDSLVIPAGVQKFIESKKSTLKSRMDEVASKAIREDWEFEFGVRCCNYRAEGRPSNATITGNKTTLVW
jgi:hypothetical protein